MIFGLGPKEKRDFKDQGIVLYPRYYFNSWNADFKCKFRKDYSLIKMGNPMKNLLKQFVFLLSIIILVFSYNKVAITKDKTDSSVIAIVNGEEILYKDIKLDNISLQLFDTKGLTPLESQNIIKKNEKERLVGKIWEIIKNSAIKNLALTVTNNEIESEVNKRFEAAGIDEKKASEISLRYSKLIKALEDWQKNPSNADSIYQNILSNTSITKEEWRVFQSVYNTPEKLLEMQALIPEDLNDMKQNTRKSVEKDLLFNKMRDIICADVSVSDTEVETYYQKKYLDIPEKPNFNKVKEILRQELMNEKKKEAESKWWQKQYNNSKISIIDDDYKDVVIENLVMPYNLDENHFSDSSNKIHSRYVEQLLAAVK